MAATWPAFPALPPPAHTARQPSLPICTRSRYLPQDAFPCHTFACPSCLGLPISGPSRWTACLPVPCLWFSPLLCRWMGFVTAGYPFPAAFWTTGGAPPGPLHTPPQFPPRPRDHGPHHTAPTPAPHSPPPAYTHLPCTSSPLPTAYLIHCLPPHYTFTFTGSVLYLLPLYHCGQLDICIRHAYFFLRCRVPCGTTPHWVLVTTYAALYALPFTPPPPFLCPLPAITRTILPCPYAVVDYLRSHWDTRIPHCLTHYYRCLPRLFFYTTTAPPARTHAHLRLHTLHHLRRTLPRTPHIPHPTAAPLHTPHHTTARRTCTTAPTLPHTHHATHARTPLRAALHRLTAHTLHTLPHLAVGGRAGRRTHLLFCRTCLYAVALPYGCPSLFFTLPHSATIPSPSCTTYALPPPHTTCLLLQTTQPHTFTHTRGLPPYLPFGGSTHALHAHLVHSNATLPPLPRFLVLCRVYHTLRL